MNEPITHLQGGEQRFPCGCITNLPKAREGLRVYRVCDAMLHHHDEYRTISRNLFQSPDARQEAESHWAVIKKHIEDSRAGRAPEGTTKKNRAAEAHWG